MERALVGISGTRIIAGETVKISYFTQKETKFIVIELEKPTPLPPPPPSEVRFIEIWDVGNVIIGMELLQKDKLGDNVETIDIGIETEDGCALHITKASLDDLEWIIGEDPVNTFINRISPQSSLVKFARLHIKLQKPIDKQEAAKILKGLGISEENFTLKG
jgi:hypothetical protein